MVVVRSLKRQSGLTLIELLAAIIISLVLVVGSFALWQVANRGSSQNQAMQDLLAVTSGVRSLYNGQPNYGVAGTDFTATAQTAGVFPSNMVSGGAVADAWGGAAKTVSTGTGFTIEFDGVPPESCIKMASAGGSTWSGVAINGAAQALPVTVAAATAACNLAGSGPGAGNTIVWTTN